MSIPIRRFHIFASYALLPWMLLMLVSQTASAQKGKIDHGVRARIALRVPEWTGAARQDEVVTSGIPLAKGTLRDPSRCRLLDERGREVPFVGTVLTRWPDGSVKWLLLDFRASAAASSTVRFTLECGVSSSVEITGARVQVAERDSFIDVRTGAVRFRVRRDRYTFLDGVWIYPRGQSGHGPGSSPILVAGRGDGQLEIETTPPGPPEEENWLRDAAGGPRQRFAAVVTDALVEFHNPLRAVILVRGEYRDPMRKSIGPF